MPSANRWCVAEGCNSADCKRGKYGFMSGIEFFPFPSQKKAPKARKRWLELLRREDYDPNKRHRLCSRHFVDGKPTDNHPYPDLFAYIKYKQSCNPRSAPLLSKLSKCRDEENWTKHTATNTCTDHTEEMPMAMMLVDFPDTDEVGHKIFIPVINDEIVETSQIPQKDGIMIDHVYQKSRDDVHDVCVQTTITMEDMEIAEKKLKSLEDSDEENMRPSVVNKITQSDETVRKYTGLPSLLMLNTLFGILKKTSPVLNYWSGQGSCNLPPYHEDPGRKKTGPPRKLTMFHEFLLTLVRLRLALLTFVDYRHRGIHSRTRERMDGA
ncbi:uncharacterized protein [Argopecten irradians]|uniref:uncharacterized protein n=1 Tax=Argopecten irradians TaxID=31199 RepID=UPI00371EC6B1